MSYYGYGYRSGHDFEVTKREIVVSIGFIALFLILGLFIGNQIDKWIFDTNEKYNKAAQLSENEKFDYALKTNFGYIFAYGDLNSIGTVHDENINGYMAINRNLEKYTRHTRTETYKCGKSTCTRTRVYWTWDHQRTDKFSVSNVNYMGREFRYSQFPIPDKRYLKTVRCGHNLRYVYYVNDVHYRGTLFTNANNNTINESEFKPGVTIDNALEKYQVGIGYKLAFWIPYIILLIALTIGFYYLENKWLYAF